jgi:hypothetical protein
MKFGGMNFHIGDKVRIVGYKSRNNGKLGEIMAINNCACDVKFENDDAIWRYRIDYLELETRNRWNLKSGMRYVVYRIIMEK